jgi:hypothetical protein
MPFGAFCFGEVASGWSVAPVEVDFDRDGFKVVWSDAPPISAEVVKGESCGNRPDEILVSDSMRSEFTRDGLGS